MKGKLFAGFFIFFLMAAFASAMSVVNVNIPTPEQTYTSTRAVPFKFMLDSDASICTIEIVLSNGTYLYNYSLGSGVNATTGSDLRTFNATITIPAESGIGAYHNWTIYCGGVGNQSYNTTFRFGLRTIRPTAVYPANASYLPSKILPIALIVNNNLGAGRTCQQNLCNTSCVGYLSNLTNSTGTTWVNATTIATGIDTPNGQFFNMTYRCNDTVFYESEPSFFVVDTVAPTIIINGLIPGPSYVTLNATITDNNPSSCYARIFNSTGGYVRSNTGISSGTGTASNCQITIYPTDPSTLGGFQAQFNATDKAGNTGVTSVNQSLIVSLISAGWDMLTWAEPVNNLTTICSRVSGCTQASWFNNSNGQFVTYNNATPTINANVQVANADPVLIYSTTDTYLMANDTLPLNSATSYYMLYNNTWNALGLTRSANMTSVLTAITNATTNLNISMASIDQGSAIYTCVRSIGLCAGTNIPATNITLPKGEAVWVLTDQNAANYTLNRTGIGI